MLVSADISEAQGVGTINLLIIYEEGIVLKLYSVVPMVTPDNYNSIMAKFCLGKNQLELEVGSLLGTIYIMEPFTSGLSQLSPYQEDVIGRQIRIHQLVPFENYFGITTQEATDLAVKGGDNCLGSKNLFSP